ncbi:hypothetical protein ACE6H2_000052 [Prunus campanulata]
MDIDLLLIGGGWINCYRIGSNFMAKSGKSVPQLLILTRSSLSLLLFHIGLLLLLVVPHFARPTPSEFNNSKSLTMAAGSSSSTATQLLQSSMDLHPKQAKKSAKNNQQFEASAHEVPSGPNPESNK